MQCNVKSQSPSRTNLLDSQSVKTDISIHVAGVEWFANKSVLSGIFSFERALVSHFGNSHSVTYRSILFVCVYVVSSRFCHIRLNEISRLFSLSRFVILRLISLTKLADSSCML